MRDEYRYLTEEELEALIADVEEKSMIAPPVYLKERILEEVRKEATVPLKNVETPIKKKVNLQFLLYSAKIMAGAAAALICITIVPFDTGRELLPMAGRNMETLIEEDAERYKEEKQKLVAEMEADYYKEQEAWNSQYGENADASKADVMGAIGERLGIGQLGNGAGIVNKISNLFGMEEKNHE